MKEMYYMKSLMLATAVAVTGCSTLHTHDKALRSSPRIPGILTCTDRIASGPNVPMCEESDSPDVEPLPTPTDADLIEDIGLRVRKFTSMHYLPAKDGLYRKKQLTTYYITTELLQTSDSSATGYNGTYVGFTLHDAMNAYLKAMGSKERV